MPLVRMPLLIRKFDIKVAEYIQSVCLSGGIVNSNIVIVAVKCIIAHNIQLIERLLKHSQAGKKMGRMIFASRRVHM